MTAPDLRFRQIHLDFHTSGLIPDVGRDFAPERFAARLADAGVNSVTCFARCHHGWLYYNSARFPELVHPHLQQRDLLRQQIEACHARGIRVPIYITVQWDERIANAHPQWRVMTPEGQLEGTPPYQPGFYRRLCLNTPYVDWLERMTEDVLDHLPVDGLFFDIVAPMDCSCAFCRADMAQQGIDASDTAARQAFGRAVEARFMERMTAFVRARNADCTIFYNAGHVGPRHRALREHFSHLELESLPSGGWGYLHFPLAMRYARTLGLPCLGMTGKFHTFWGDFHSFKNPAALQFECFQMAALGARCSIGDQLHPRGELCEHTYALIGSVYHRIAAAEPWCQNARPVNDLAVLTPEAFAATAGHDDLPRAMMGAVRLLQELKQQFDIIDTEADYSRYRVLVLPDVAPLSPAQARKIDQYVKNGGALLATHRAGQPQPDQAFALSCLPVRYVGPSAPAADYFLPHADAQLGLPSTEHVMYQPGVHVEAAADAQVLAQRVLPYFPRDWKHYCSHRQTPSSGEQRGAALVQRGQVIYAAHALFSDYQHCAPRWCRQIVAGALARLLPRPLVQVQGPAALLAILNSQPEHSRFVLHLLYYLPQRNSDTIDILEDVPPLHDVPVTLHLPQPVQTVKLAPEGRELPFEQWDDACRFVVPRIEGWQMIELTV